jgi:hypothetical protein
LNFEGEADGVTTDDILNEVLESASSEYKLSGSHDAEPARV